MSFLALPVACGDAGPPGGTADRTPTELRGRVTAPTEEGDAHPLRGASIEVIAIDPRDDAPPDYHADRPRGRVLATTVADDTGRFEIDVPDGWATVRISAEGHVPALRTAEFGTRPALAFDVELQHPPAPIAFEMPRLGDPDVILAFDSSAGRPYARLHVEPGDLVDEAGDPVLGAIEARVDAPHPQDDHKRGNVASLLSAARSPDPLAAYGMLSVALAQGDQRVSVAPGRTLRWEFAVANEQREAAQAAWAAGRVKNYSLDASTGLWRAEPAAIAFDGDTFVVEREHFSSAAVAEEQTFVTQREPCADPGRHAVILLTFSNPRTPSDVAQTLVQTAVDYVSQVEDPRVLVVLDDFHHGEFPEDAAYIASKVHALGYHVKVIDEPANGITESHVEGYDVVWFLNPGWPIDDRASLETLAAFRERGGGFVLSGDDITLNYANQADTSAFTFLEYLGNGTTTCGHTTNDNRGESYRIAFEEDTDHVLAAGLEGLSFLYGDDIDHSRPVNDGETVLAWATLDGFPSCDVRIPVVVALDLDDSKQRPECGCEHDNDCAGEQHCLGNTCLHCGDEQSSCTSSDDCCGALVCNDGTCGEPCGHAGDACLGGGVCCGSLSCNEGTCDTCALEAAACASDADCCGTLSCIDGACSPCRGTSEGCSDAGDCCGQAQCAVQTQSITVDDEQCAGSRLLTATVRDFRAAHPDFQAANGSEQGIVAAQLGEDDTPVYAAPASSRTTHGADAFAQWFHDVDGVNEAIDIELELVETEEGVFQYRNNAFFPIDGRGFGNEGNSHNYHFTLELHSEFVYRGGEVFQFTGDDDIFVFINGRLAIDLGGVHSSQSRAVQLDQAAAALGIEPGNIYPLDIFFAERHTVASNFRIDTTIDCLTNRRTEEVVIGSCEPPPTDDPRCRDYGASVIGLETLSMHGDATVQAGTGSGGVGSNGEVRMTGRALVEGDASSADDDVVLLGTASIDGEIVTGEGRYDAPVPTDAFDRVRYTNDNASLAGAAPAGEPLALRQAETLHFGDGDYWLESLHLVHRSSISCDGQVRLFVEGDVKVANRASLGSPGACALSVFSKGRGAVKFVNESTVAATVHAPLADFKLANEATLEGSVVARRVTLNDDTQILATADPLEASCEPDDPEDPDTDGTTGGDDGADETGLPPLPDLPR